MFQTRIRVLFKTFDFEAFETLPFRLLLVKGTERLQIILSSIHPGCNRYFSHSDHSISGNNDRTLDWSFQKKKTPKIEKDEIFIK